MKHTVALLNTSRLGVAALFSFAMVACGGADGENPSNSGELTAEQQQEAMRILRSRGADLDTLKILRDGTWLLEEDISLNPRDVLNGTAFRQDKGYRNGINNRRLNLTMSTNPTYQLTAEWQQAFLVAIAEIQAKTNVTFGPGEGVRTIEVLKAPLPVNSTDPVVRLAWGCTKGWFGGNQIVINATYNCLLPPPPPPPPGSPPPPQCGATSIDALPIDEKIQTATHELAHQLGLDHPPFAFANSQNNLIPGTQVYNFFAPYKSLMYWGCPQLSPTDHIEKILTPDDVASLDYLYPDL